MEIDPFQNCSSWEPAQVLAWDHTTQRLRKALFVWLHGQIKDVYLPICEANHWLSRCCRVNDSFLGLRRQSFVSHPCLKHPSCAPILVSYTFPTYQQSRNADLSSCVCLLYAWLHREDLIWTLPASPWFLHPEQWLFFPAWWPGSILKEQVHSPGLVPGWLLTPPLQKTTSYRNK